MSTWFITGCSTGLGRALAEAVIAEGHNAVVTARDVDKVADLAADNTDRVLPLPLDVTDAAQITNAVGKAEEKFGGIDVLVNNAGYGYRAAVEEGDDSDIRRLFETQFFGAVAMIKAVLPGMRARRFGAIINISTIGVQIMPAGSGYYAASKAALEAMSGALRGELQPLGISVTVVEPGAFRTDFAGRSLTSRALSLMTMPTLPANAVRSTTRPMAPNPATRPRLPKPSSPRSSPTSRPHSCCSATMPSPPTAGSPGPDSTPSRLGNTSPQIPTSTPELNDLEVEQMGQVRRS
jgi:NAD(P)-dependent dehydrogenase (short-subunit alcohol dehydrogenase family)